MKVKNLLCMLVMILGSLGIAKGAEWTVYPYFYPIPQNIIDTGKKVYYVAGNSLFSYDYENDESESYTSFNKLHDREIISINYNREKNYLFVFYQSGAVDLVYDDGSVYYLTELRDADIDRNFRVLDVSFDGDFIYVGTSFGIVKFNSARKEVSDYGFYPSPIHASTIMGNRLVVSYNGQLKYIDKNASLHSIDNYKQLFGIGTLKFLEGAGDNKLIYGSGVKPNICNVMEIDFEKGTRVSGENFNSTATKLEHFYRDKEGNFMYIADGTLFKVDKNLNHSKLFDLSPEYQSGLSAVHDGSGKVWNLTGEGLLGYSVSADGGLTLTTDRFVPEQLNTRNVMQFQYMPKSKELWIGNATTTGYKYKSTNTQARLSPVTVSVYNLESDRFVNVTPYPVKAHMEPSLSQQKTYGEYILASSGIAVDPDEPDTYFLASGNDGLYKIKDGRVEGIFDSNNSPFASFWGCNVFFVKIDHAGNLWAVSYAFNGSNGINILPASLRGKNPSEITADDWVCVTDDGYAGGIDFSMLEYKNRYMICGGTGSNGKIFIFDNNNTPTNFSDDKSMVITQLIDQDGKVHTPARLSCFTEDKNGRIWFGTEMGVFVISDLNSVNGSKINVNKVKVPRNDGTNEADYLLGSDLVIDIAVDDANRKWIATANSGLYQVSPNGNEILNVFGPNNSPLCSNYVNTVFVLPGSNDLFVGTNEGLFRYDYVTEGAATQLNDLLIYPNPVKPEYVGPVTIKGLMDNTLVKIVDSAGNMVAQGRSENGEYRWNCQNIWGAKVPTGVYYVLASENSSGNGTATIGKIMVIN